MEAETSYSVEEVRRDHHYRFSQNRFNRDPELVLSVYDSLAVLYRVYSFVCGVVTQYILQELAFISLSHTVPR